MLIQIMNSLKINDDWEIIRQTLFNQINLYVIKPKLMQHHNIIAVLRPKQNKDNTSHSFYFQYNSSFKKYPQNDPVETTISIIQNNKETMKWDITKPMFIPADKIQNSIVVLSTKEDILLHQNFVLSWNEPIRLPIFISPLYEHVQLNKNASWPFMASFWTSREKAWTEQHSLLATYPMPQLKNNFTDFVTLQGQHGVESSGAFFTVTHYPYTSLFFRIHAEGIKGRAFVFCESENGFMRYCPRSYEWSEGQNKDYQFLIPPPEIKEQKIRIGILFHKEYLTPSIKIIDWYCIRMKSSSIPQQLSSKSNEAILVTDNIEQQKIDEVTPFHSQPSFNYESIYLTQFPPLYPSQAQVPIHLIIQVYIPKKIERLSEIQHCFNMMVQNPWITHIHAFAENFEVYQIFDQKLKSAKISKVNLINYGKRLSYFDGWNYARNELLQGWIIIANSDVYFDNHLGNLHTFLPQANIQTGQPILYALNRFEHNVNHPPIVYGKQYLMNLHSPWMKPYEESLFSQDVWIVHSNTLHHTDVEWPPHKEIDIFVGGIPGCDNWIAFVFAKYNWLVCNPCTFIPVIHYDHSSLMKDPKTGKYVGKGGISSNFKPIGGIEDYLFLPTLRTPPTLDMGTPEWKTHIESILTHTFDQETDLQDRFRRRAQQIQLNYPRYLKYPQSIDIYPGMHKWYLNGNANATPIESTEVWTPTPKSKYYIVQSPRVEKWAVIDIAGPAPREGVEEHEKFGEVFPSEIAIYLIILPNEMKPLNGPWGTHYWPAVQSNCMDSIRRIYLPPEARSFGLAIEITKWKGPFPCARIQTYVDGLDAPLPVAPWFHHDWEEERIDGAYKKWKHIFWNHQYWASLTSETFWKGHWNIALDLDPANTKCIPNFILNEENWRNLQLKTHTTRQEGWNQLGWGNFQIWKKYWTLWEQEHQLSFWDNWSTPAGEPISDNISSDISIVVSIKNRKEHLIHNLSSWLYHDEVKEVILVDWSSTPPLEKILYEHPQGKDPRIRILRVENQHTFIRTWCQNWGAKWVRHPLLFKLDVDIQLKPGWVQRNPMFPGMYRAGDWRFARNKNETYTHGSVLCWTRDFWWINGYNERITSYGHDDCDFYYRLQISGLKRCLFNLDDWHHLPHNDHDRIKEVDPTMRMNPESEIMKNQAKITQFPPWNRADTSQKFKVLSVNSRIVITEMI